MESHNISNFSWYCSPSPSRLEPEEFLVIQTAADKSMMGSGITPTAPGAIPAPSGMQMSQSGRGGSVVCMLMCSSYLMAIVVYISNEIVRRGSLACFCQISICCWFWINTQFDFALLSRSTLYGWWYVENDIQARELIVTNAKLTSLSKCHLSWAKFILMMYM
jgi:hypothetical protein